MLEDKAQEIKEEGRFETYLGSKDEAIYTHENDVWVIREKNGDLYSVWNPTHDVLITQ